MKKYRIIKDFPGNNSKVGAIICGDESYCNKFPEFYKEIKQAPKIGTRVKIKGTVTGCYVAEEKIGIVTDKIGINGLSNNEILVDDLEIFNVEIAGKVYRVACTDWEEVIELDYEIMSLKGELTGIVYKNTDINWEKTLNFWKYDQNYKIHSIKRLSDGEIFSIGDKMDGFGMYARKNGNISKFYIEGNKLKVGIRGVGIVNLSSCKHRKSPLFTTEDGVDIFDKYCILFETSDKNFEYLGKTSANWLATYGFKNCPNIKAWFKKEAAEKYIQENKPMYSKKQMISFADYASDFCIDDEELNSQFIAWQEES